MPIVDAIFLDGPAIVHILQPKNIIYFESYKNNIFGHYVLEQLKKCARVDIVWDRYDDSCFKEMTRNNRGSGSVLNFNSKTKLPSNWGNFMRESINKKRLFEFLSNSIMDLNVPANKQLIATLNETVICVPERENVSCLSPCLHEEADTRIFVHML